jgi:steroid 5-alpha reductase family enzyme
MILMLVVATAILVVNLPYIDTPEWFLVWWEISYRIWWSMILGILFALFWLIFETIADRQLAEFVKTKKPGEIFTTWLYRYSRHPNYFWESMFWLGVSLIGIVYAWVAIVWWVAITCLLLFVSGVPMQEARYTGRPEWEEYKSRTSVFVPWWPSK